MQPTNAGVWNSRCWARAIVGANLTAALDDCNESLRLKPDVANTIDSRALVKLKLGDLDAALADYDKALGLNPKLAGSLLGRGVVREKKGDSAGAEADFAAAKAIKADMADEWARYNVK